MLPSWWWALLFLVGVAHANTSDYETFVETSSDLEEKKQMETLQLLPLALDIFNIDRVNGALKENNATVSPGCRQNLFSLFQGLRDKKIWAMTILDANGKYGSGYLFGNRYWMGSQTECLDLPNHAASPPPFPVSFFIARFQLHHNVTTFYQVVNVGFCLPEACSRQDLTAVLNRSLPEQATVVQVRRVPDENFNLFYQKPFIALMVVVTIVVIMVILGTTYEILLDKRGHRTLTSKQSTRNKEIGQITELTDKKDSLQFYSPEKKPQRSNSLSSAESTSSVHSGSSCDSSQHKPGTLGQIALCFSLKKNLLKICDTRRSDALGCVHGLRVVSMFWVVAGHTCMITVPFVDNVGYRIVVERDFLFQSIGNGAFSVDTFFFLSGLLIAFVFYKAEKQRTEELSAAVHAKMSSVKLIGGVTYRYIRLTPPYAVTLVLSYLVARWFLHNSVFKPPLGDMDACPTYWWRNLLYINTLFPVNQMCVIWSWYLADDTQFYILGLIILLISTRYKKFSVISTGFLLVLAWITTAIITLYTNHKPSVDEPLGLFDQLYDKPWTRLGPYVVGMAVGYYLAKVNCQATFHKGVVAAGWAISMTTTFALVYGLYGELTQIQSAAYVSLSHTAWALALSWIVVACVTGYGGLVNQLLSLKVLTPLSRLSYCAYLIHPLIMLSTVAHMETPAHLQRDTMIISIFGYAFAAYLAALVLTLLFEAPAVALLSIFHPLKRKIK